MLRRTRKSRCRANYEIKVDGATYTYPYSCTYRKGHRGKHSHDNLSFALSASLNYDQHGNGWYSEYVIHEAP